MPVSLGQLKSTFRCFSTIDSFPQEFNRSPVHLGIGNYDGFHCGHRVIFEKAKKAAEGDGGHFGALTFFPHPEVFFRGEGAVQLIFPRERKKDFFALAGLDFAVCEFFSKTFAEISAEEFPDFLLRKMPTLRGIYIGDNFHFGAHRRGDAKLLTQLCSARGISVVVVDPVNYAGERISSTRIREVLVAGKIREANAMLGEPYKSSATVISGNKLGRTIGFPTLNTEWSPECRPLFGVYVVRLSVPATGQVFRGIANYGVRPTIEQADAFPPPLLEVHLLGVSAEMCVPTYGDFVCVEWLDFVRPEKRFETIDLLKSQLECDKVFAQSRCLST